MKKLIALFVVISLYCGAQNPFFPTITILSAKPDTVCNGSILKITFTVRRTTQSGATTTTSIFITDQSNQHSLNILNCDQDFIQNLPGCTVTQIGPGQLAHYTYDFVIPQNFYTNQLNSPGIIHSGTGKIYGTNTGSVNIVTFINKDCNFVYIPETAGIEEYNLNKDKEIIYFDLQGNRIELRFNEPIIWQCGTSHGKIRIQN